jgi:hypothetical protein
MYQASDESTGPAGATRLVRRRIAEGELGQPKRESLFSYTPRPGQEENLGEPLTSKPLRETLPGLLVTN